MLLFETAWAWKIGQESLVHQWTCQGWCGSKNRRDLWFKCNRTAYSISERCSSLFCEKQSCQGASHPPNSLCLTLLESFRFEVWEMRTFLDRSFR